MLVYAIEIKKAIQCRNEARIPGIEYCAGFEDHENAGVSSIVTYSYELDTYNIFMDDNLPAFAYLVMDHKGPIVGFNNIRFDNAVISHHVEFGRRSQEEALKLLNDKSYDILAEIWKSLGLNENEFSNLHAGYGLDACCKANNIQGKTGHGAKAPVDYQEGRIGQLLDYNLNDVNITKKLLDLITANRRIFNPKKKGEFLSLRPPNG